MSEQEKVDARETGKRILCSILNEMLDHAEQVAVNYSVGDRTTIYKVNCHPQSLGQLIGAKGKNIGGIRAVISAMMARKGIRAIIEIPYVAHNNNRLEISE
ncbi:KH domain-containing protein [Bdellovibrio sp. HCB185ZH]|uniref:KH domain-containing protein n=1 Tax=Bdellovibrio sp. HCB185ZH TaxID=3394235 RepID=UPI0039A6CB63